VMSQPPQFVIHQRHERFERLAVSLPPAHKQLRNRTGCVVRQGAMVQAPGVGQRGRKDNPSFFSSQESENTGVRMKSPVFCRFFWKG
jgi:hypothetical protein